MRDTKKTIICFNQSRSKSYYCYSLYFILHIFCHFLCIIILLNSEFMIRHWCYIHFSTQFTITSIIRLCDFSCFLYIIHNNIIRCLPRSQTLFSGAKSPRNNRYTKRHYFISIRQRTTASSSELLFKTDLPPRATLLLF